MRQKPDHGLEWAYRNVAQRAMYPLSAFAAIVIFVCAAVTVMTGHWAVLIPGMIAVTVGGRVVLRLLYEDPQDLRALTADMSSLSFAFGQGIVLPITLAFAARGWHDVPTDWRWSFGILPAVMGFGVLFGWVHHTLDEVRYLEADTHSSTLCPTKVWHDWVVVPVTTALLVWLLAPQLAGNHTDFARPALVFFGMFLLLVAVDHLRGLDARRQHVRWDPDRFMPADV